LQVGVIYDAQSNDHDFNDSQSMHNYAQLHKIIIITHNNKKCGQISIEEKHPDRGKVSY